MRIIVAVFVVGIIVGLVYLNTAPPNQGQGPTVAERLEKRANFERNQKETLVAWLESQRKGETGYEYWCDDVTKVMLFALQSYEVVKRGMLAYTVRIHSSTKGGTPIVCLWRISINLDGKVYHVEENEEYLKRRRRERKTTKDTTAYDRATSLL